MLRISALIIEIIFVFIALTGCTQPSIPTYLTETAVWDIAISDEAVLWFATANNGIVKFDGENWTNYTKDDGLANEGAQSIAISPDNTVWIGAFGEGVSRFDGATWKTYTTDEGLADDRISDILIAPDNTLWIASDKNTSHFIPPK